MKKEASGSSKDTNRFYAEVPTFSQFEKLAQDENYHPVPQDWFVVISDVEGSTQAIREGRYRDVNLLGAASIAALQRVFGGVPFAFVFGGDGATFLIPPEKLESAKSELLKLKELALSQFNLKLRVGVVAVEEIRQGGQKIEISKFEIAKGKETVLIRGGGLAWAEYHIKTYPRKYTLKSQQGEATESFKGLSCRWQPLKSKKGKTLAVLVQPRLLDSTQIFQSILEHFREIFGGDLESANPVQPETMKYKSFWQMLKDEWKLDKKKISGTFLSRFTEILLCYWAFKLNLPAPFEKESYTEQIPAHSDYRKYDDMLRLVLDCSPEQADQIESYLQGLFDKGEVFFGLSKSSSALMTCLVENLSEGGHIHFIDGSDGGYALAAQHLAAQITLWRQKDVTKKPA